MKTEVEVLREENWKLWDAYLEMDTCFQRGDVVGAHNALRNFRKRNAEAKPAEAPADAKPNLRTQIDELANFIMREIPGEPSRSEGAVDVAIRLLRNSPHHKDAKASAATSLQEAEGRKADQTNAEIRFKQIREDLAVALEDLIWCSGSNDFQPEGVAHKGWNEVSRRLHTISARWFPPPAPGSKERSE